jgi:hypothetical protein
MEYQLIKMTKIMMSYIYEYILQLNYSFYGGVFFKF